MAKFFNVLGILTIIGGIISGIYLGRQVSEIAEFVGLESGFDWDIASTYWIYGTVSGLLFIAFAKCYERLEDLEWRVRNISDTVEKTYILLNKSSLLEVENEKKDFNLQDFIARNSTPPSALK